MPNHVYKTVELTGSSKAGIEDAIANAIARAAKTVRNLRWFQVIETRGHIENGKIAHWQVTVKAGFTLEMIQGGGMRMQGGRAVRGGRRGLVVSVSARWDEARSASTRSSPWRRGRETPAGAAYDAAFGRSMQAQLGMAMAKCFTRTPEPDIRKFDMLVELDPAGKVTEVLVRPETNVALCFKPRIGEARSGAALPAYWVHVEMK
jgi:flavin-binding protein dodecin